MKNMKKTVLFGILNEYADWEAAFLTTALQDGILDKKSDYEVKTISTTLDPIKTIGGFTTLPDYKVDRFSDEFSGIILIGVKSWRTEEAKKFLPIVKQAVQEEKIVGAICDATVFLGANGLLNKKNHTSNNPDELIKASGANYTGQNRYQNEQAVQDGNLITANGTAYLEFTSKVMKAFTAYSDEYIENNYNFYKLGLIEMLKKMNA